MPVNTLHGLNNNSPIVDHQSLLFEERPLTRNKELSPVHFKKKEREREQLAPSLQLSKQRWNLGIQAQLIKRQI